VERRKIRREGRGESVQKRGHSAERRLGRGGVSCLKKWLRSREDERGQGRSPGVLNCREGGFGCEKGSLLVTIDDNG